MIALSRQQAHALAFYPTTASYFQRFSGAMDRAEFTEAVMVTDRILWRLMTALAPCEDDRQAAEVLEVFVARIKDVLPQVETGDENARRHLEDAVAGLEAAIKALEPGAEDGIRPAGPA